MLAPSPVEPGRTRSGPRLSGVTLTTALVVMIAGTFLPWLQSGSVVRNSYAAGGAARRLLGPDGLVGQALAVWPFVSLAAAVAVALLLLRLWPLAAIISLLAAAAGGTVAGLALGVRGSALVGPATLGPAVTLAGAALVAVAVALRLTPLDRQLGRTR